MAVTKTLRGGAGVLVARTAGAAGRRVAVAVSAAVSVAPAVGDGIGVSVTVGVMVGVANGMAVGVSASRRVAIGLHALSASAASRKTTLQSFQRDLLALTNGFARILSRVWFGITMPLPEQAGVG